MTRFRALRGLLAAALLLAAAVPTWAQDLLMIRSREAFPEAMATLQDSIVTHGYTVSRVQRVDIGLTKFGFKTDKYRVVFFAKEKEMKELSTKYPDLIPYLPLKMAIFAEGDQTLVVCANPARFSRFFPAPDLAPVFRRWEHDMQSILDDVRNAQ